MLVAEHGSLRRAADYLGVHQSVVGRRIALLESRLGILLFERDHFGSKLTDVGRKFLLDAREGTDRILQAVEQVRRFVRHEMESCGLARRRRLHPLFIRAC